MTTAKKTPRAKAPARKRASPAKALPRRRSPPAKAAARPKTQRVPQAAAPAPVLPVPLASGGAVATRGDKSRKPKLVRDSFTIPKGEFAVLDDLKQRAVRAGKPAKKSEVLRAGIKALAAMGDAAFLAALAAVPAIKTGRPAKN